MKYLVIVSFCSSINPYIEESDSQLIVKFGDNFNELMNEVRSAFGSTYVFSSVISVFVDQISNDDLIAEVETVINEIIKKNNELMLEEYDKFR